MSRKKSAIQMADVSIYDREIHKGWSAVMMADDLNQWSATIKAEYMRNKSAWFRADFLW